MKKWICLTAIMLWGMLSLSACSDPMLSEEERQDIIDQITILETSEYDLVYFNINYQQYLEQVNGIIDDTYLKSIEDQIIFGYDDKKYTRADLVDMSTQEWEEHKDHMLPLIQGIGMDNQKSVISFSKVYEDEASKKIYIYTTEDKVLNGKAFTKTNRKYTFDRIKDRWLVTSVEFDKFTYGSEQTEEEIQTSISGLKYQTHADKPVEYIEETITLEGTGTS
ncbi:hypothetical protein [Marinicrinis lubricantis]|uniref:SnoaL-like domain-containing protein n=1 Tax=Marinicrinis lubricantis TaxID=2086470 RepID=A0ABW1ILZ0_9BACL